MGKGKGDGVGRTFVLESCLRVVSQIGGLRCERRGHRGHFVVLTTLHEVMKWE